MANMQDTDALSTMHKISPELDGGFWKNHLKLFQNWFLKKKILKYVSGVFSRHWWKPKKPSHIVLLLTYSRFLLCNMIEMLLHVHNSCCSQNCHRCLQEGLWQDPGLAAPVTIAGILFAAPSHYWTQPPAEFSEPFLTFVHHPLGQYCY